MAQVVSKVLTMVNGPKTRMKLHKIVRMLNAPSSHHNRPRELQA